MVESYGQRVFVDAPEFLKRHLRLRAGVDENERELGALDGFVDFRNGMARGVAGPWDAGVGVQDVDDRLGAGRGFYDYLACFSSSPLRGGGREAGGVQTCRRLGVGTPPLTLPSPPQGGRGFFAKQPIYEPLFVRDRCAEP